MLKVFPNYPSSVSIPLFVKMQSISVSELCVMQWSCMQITMAVVSLMIYCTICHSLPTILQKLTFLYFFNPGGRGQWISRRWESPFFVRLAHRFDILLNVMFGVWLFKVSFPICFAVQMVRVHRAVNLPPPPALSTRTTWPCHTATWIKSSIQMKMS